MSVNITSQICSAFVAANTSNTQSVTVGVGEQLYIVVSPDNISTSANMLQPNIKTFNGVDIGEPIAQAPNNTTSVARIMFVYRVVSPPVGTFNLITRMTGVSGAHMTAAFTVKATSNLEVAVGVAGFGQSTTPSVAATGSIAGDLIVAALSYDNISPASVNETGGQTVIVENGDASGTLQLSTKAGGTNPVNFTWSAGSNQRWANCTILFRDKIESVTSFNGSSDIYPGQQDVNFVTAGFPGGVVSAITTNAAGVSVSGIVLTVPNDGTGTADISGFVEGGAYPILPVAIEHTFANGAATAKITKQHNLRPGYSQVAYLNAIAPSDRVFAWHLQQVGISIADGTRVIWPDTPGFSFDANGDTTSDALRTVTAWVRDIATGLMSEWIVTVDDAGDIVSATSMREIAMQKAEMRGITMRGIGVKMI